MRNVSHKRATAARGRALLRIQPEARKFGKVGKFGSFGLVDKFARDLAARIQGTIAPRSARFSPPVHLVRGRAGRGGTAGGALAGIADSLLAMNLPNPMDAIEIALLSQAMIDAEGNITAAGRLLGIHRKAVERLVVKHKVHRDVARRRGAPARARTR